VNSSKPDISVSPIANVFSDLISIEIVPSTGFFGILKLHVKLKFKKNELL